MISLKNFTKEISVSIQKLATKNTVREVDEESKGHFIAYVDEGETSYDVGITFDSNKEVIKASCDCESQVEWCRHKTALLIHLAKGQTAKKKKIIKSKDPFDRIIDDISIEDAKKWIRDVCQQNEDLKLSFIHKHSHKDISTISSAEIEKNIEQSIKAVAGRKKLLDSTQINKIIELWKGFQEPIFEAYANDVTNLELFTLVDKVTGTCLWYNATKLYNEKIPKFLMKAFDPLLEVIANIKDETKWNHTVGAFVDHLALDAVHRLNMIYAKFLFQLNNLVPIERKRKLTELLMQKYIDLVADGGVSVTDITETLFDMVLAADLFKYYSGYFLPIRWNNSFNKKLIQTLIDHEDYELVESYCEEQIQANVQNTYSIMYLEFLRDIYKKQGFENDLVTVYQRLIPLTYNIEDYKFVINHLDETEIKAFRSQILSHTRHRALYDKSLMNFNFEVAALHNDAIKMIEYINENVAFSIIDKYKSVMEVHDRMKFLKKLIFLPSTMYKSKLSLPTEDRLAFESIIRWIIKSYTTTEIKTVIEAYKRNNFSWSSSNILQNELLKELSNQP